MLKTRLPSASRLAPADARHNAPRSSLGRPRRHHEVVLELPLIAVIDEVDPGIDVVELDFRISRNVRPPRRGVGAEKIVDLTRKRVDALSRCGSLPADQTHRDAVKRGCTRLAEGSKRASLPDNAS